MAIKPVTTETRTTINSRESVAIVAHSSTSQPLQGISDQVLTGIFGKVMQYQKQGVNLAAPGVVTTINVIEGTAFDAYIADGVFTVVVAATEGSGGGGTTPTINFTLDPGWTTTDNTPTFNGPYANAPTMPYRLRIMQGATQIQSLTGTTGPSPSGTASLTAAALANGSYTTLQSINNGTETAGPGFTVAVSGATLAAPQFDVISPAAQTSPTYSFEFPQTVTVIAGTIVRRHSSTSATMVGETTVSYTMTQGDVDAYNDNLNETGFFNWTPNTFADGVWYFEASFSMPNGDASTRSSRVAHIIDTTAAETVTVQTPASDFTPTFRIAAGGTNFTAGEALQFRTATSIAGLTSATPVDTTATAGATSDYTSLVTLPAGQNYVQGRRGTQDWSAAEGFFLLSPVTAGTIVGTDVAFQGTLNQSLAIGAAPTGGDKRLVLIAAIFQEVGTAGTFTVDSVAVATTTVALNTGWTMAYAFPEIATGTTATIGYSVSTAWRTGVIVAPFYAPELSVAQTLTQDWGTPVGQVQTAAQAITIPSGGRAVVIAGARSSNTTTHTPYISWSPTAIAFQTNEFEFDFSSTAVSASGTVTATFTVPGGFTISGSPRMCTIVIQGG